MEEKVNLPGLGTVWYDRGKVPTSDTKFDESSKNSLVNCRFTPGGIIRAKNCNTLLAKVGFHRYPDLKELIWYNLLSDCAVTIEDVDISQMVYTDLRKGDILLLDETDLPFERQEENLRLIKFSDKDEPVDLLVTGHKELRLQRIPL